MIYAYQYNNQTYTIDLHPNADGTFSAILGNRQYSFVPEHSSDGSWTFTLDGQRPHVHTAAEGNERFLHYDGSTYQLTVPDTRARRRASSAGASGGSLSAQMPGRITEVKVSEGDTVDKGQTLLLLEAMKMEIRITAPAGGKVARLLVRAGDMVERGQLLVELA